MNIDAHHHFWRYTEAEYGWIDDSMSTIRRDFLPQHLRTEIGAAGIQGVVSVQARQTLEETRWLLAMAAQNDFIRGVAGWVPLIDADAGEHLSGFSKEPKFRAVRHVLQGEPDERYMLRADFNRGIDALADFGLVYDILILERQLPQAIEFVDCHPDQVFVLDHIAKPRIRSGVVEPWRSNITELARRENVYCKVSGMVTEAETANWTPDQLRPYFDAVLEAFGPSRLMFGSDWPVCLVACGYERWAQTVRRFASDLSADEQAELFGGTAAKAYRLGG
jgi:L-fuconolactonase